MTIQLKGKKLLFRNKLSRNIGPKIVTFCFQTSLLDTASETGPKADVLETRLRSFNKDSMTPGESAAQILAGLSTIESTAVPSFISFLFF